MTQLRLDAVTVDCADPVTLAAFWAELLGVSVRGTWEQYVGLQPQREGAPRLLFQRVDRPRPARNSLHLDLHVAGRAELDPAVDRALGLGATFVETQDHGALCWTVLADPEGNVFCIVAD